MLKQTAAKPVSFAQFWANLATHVLRKLASKAHVNIVLVLKDGLLQQVRFDESVLPGDLPPV